MADHRISFEGEYLNFTCKNSRFQTDITKGFTHHEGDNYKGSVTESPLYEDEDSSLWLEHVIEQRTGTNCYWFMWYNREGNPNVIMSSVIGEDDILEVIKNIASIRL